MKWSDFSKEIGVSREETQCTEDRWWDEGYKAGEWDMFKRITVAYHEKDYYFLQDDGTVYSRDSCEYMSRDAAFDEFIKRIREEG